MKFSGPWSTREIPDGQWIRQEFGPLTVVVMNHRSEWWLACYHGDVPGDLDFKEDAEALESSASWERWDRDPKDLRIHFRPAFPGLPVVARPRGSVRISPKAKATFFVGVPAWIDVLGECQGQMVLLKSVPSEVMSKTWHGSPLAGSPGFALRTYARRVFEPSLWPGHEIVCSLSIVNEGSETLPFERLYMETQHLAVFEMDGRLWGNAARIRAAPAEHNTSSVTYSPRPASPYEDAVEISPARKGRRRKSTIQSAFSKVFGHLNPLDDPS